MRKRILLGLALVLVVMIAVTAVSRYQEIGDLRRLQITDLDLTNVADGVYTGAYGKQVLSAKLQVTVTAGQIADIQVLEPSNGLGKAGNQMISSVLSAQSLQVDIVTGASATSKLVLRTVEEALRQGLR